MWRILTIITNYHHAHYREDFTFDIHILYFNFRIFPKAFGRRKKGLSNNSSINAGNNGVIKTAGEYQ